jgi:DNA-binding CsgD family transcriptional regulator
MRLTQRDFDAALGFLRETYVLRNVDQLADYLVQALPGLVPADRTSYTMCGVLLGGPTEDGRPRIETRAKPAQSPAPDLKVFEQHVFEHPLFVHYHRTRDGQPLRISDFLSRTQYHRLGLYNEFFRHVDTEYQAAFYLPVPPPQSLGVAFSRRHRDFSDRDCGLLSALRPHLMQAHENAVAVTRLQQSIAGAAAALEEVAEGVVVLGPGERVRFATRRAREWLGAYFKYRPRQGECVPEALAGWVRAQGAHLNGNGAVGMPRQPLVLVRGGARLVLRLVSDAGQTLLLLQEQLAEISTEALVPLGLSRREADVLRWVAEGKTNIEIGIILGVSPRTVGKHLERIFRRLGVETRTAAATVARAAPTDALLPHTVN